MTIRTVTILVFALLGILLIVLELHARTANSKIPTLSRLLTGALGRRSVQVLVVLTWWWVGWHFFGDAGR